VTGFRRFLDRTTRAYAPTRRIRFAFAQNSLERFGAGRELTVLDACASEGLFAELLARRHSGWTIEAVDIDADVIALAQKSFAEANLDNAAARVGDVIDDLGDRLYDAIAALECLTLVDDDAAALESFRRALRPGGLLVGHVPDKHWQPMWSKRTTWPGELRHGYDEHELRELLRSSGLEPVRISDSTRRLALFGREVSQSHALERGGLPARAAWFPFGVAIAWLDRHGVTWGNAGGHYFEARRPLSG
jgi:SAM-dependent methyltransferase